MSEPATLLPAKTLRALSNSAVQITSWIQDTPKVREYSLGLIQTASTSVQTLAAHPDLVRMATKGGSIIEGLNRGLQLLRGLVRGCTPKSQSALWSVFEPLVLPSLPPLLSAFKHEASVTYLLVKLLSDICEHQTPFLNATQFNTLAQASLQVLRLYSQLNLGAVSFQRAKSLVEEREADRCQDLRALMKLLLNLTSRDMMDFEEEAQAGQGGEVRHAMLSLSPIDYSLFSLYIYHICVCHFFCPCTHTNRSSQWLRWRSWGCKSYSPSWTAKCSSSLV